MKDAPLCQEFLIEPNDRSFLCARILERLGIELAANRNYNFFLSRLAASAETSAVGKKIEDI